MEYADTYVSRKVAGIQDIEILRYARKSKFNVLVYGPTGPGKTSWVYAYAAIDKLPCYSISCSAGMDPTVLFGKYNPTDTPGKYVWQDGPVTSMVRNGGVLLINEVNFMPARIQSVLFSVFDKRRQIQLTEHNGEVITAHSDFQVIADMNPGYEGTRDLNPAFKNRFAIKVKWDYEREVEIKLVRSEPLLDFADQLRKATDAGTLTTPISTNMLMEFEKIFDAMGINFARLNFLSSFEDDEREAVSKAFELHQDKILRSYRPASEIKEEDEKKASLVDRKSTTTATTAIDRETFYQKINSITPAPKPTIQQGPLTKKAAYDEDDWGIEGVDFEWAEVEVDDGEDT
jgi:hypothetical protein